MCFLRSHSTCPRFGLTDHRLELASAQAKKRTRVRTCKFQASQSLPLLVLGHDLLLLRKCHPSEVSFRATRLYVMLREDWTYAQLSQAVMQGSPSFIPWPTSKSRALEWAACLPEKQ